MDPRKIRKEAEEHEKDGDALALLALTRECCDEIDRLRAILKEIREASLAYGPIEDGTEEGMRFENALTFAIGQPTTPRKGKKFGILGHMEHGTGEMRR